MKLLVANYRYFVSGGPERYMFNLTAALRDRGHEIIPFSVRYRQNEPSPFSQYFVSPLGTEDQVYFSEHNMSLGTVTSTLGRLFFSAEVRRAVRRLVNEMRPDVAYVLHYLRKLSPSLLVALKEAGVPIVVRLSDYQMLCPQAHFLRDEKPCQLCNGKDLFPSIRHKCVKNSMPASVLNAMATWFHEAMHYFDLIDRFVVTNPFMLQAMLNAGYHPKRLVLIPTFVRPPGAHNTNLSEKVDLVTYVGRIERLKGVHLLIEAAGLIRQQYPSVGWTYKIAGDGDSQYLGRLRERAAELGIYDRLEFVGRLDNQTVSGLLKQSRLQVVPSIWYENLPNSLIEGFAFGTPAVVSNIGSLSSAVVPGRHGYLFTPGDAQALADTLVQGWHDRKALEEMSTSVRMAAATDYAEDRHIKQLLEVFNCVKDPMIHCT